MFSFVNPYQSNRHKQGTSIATPRVSGAAALVVSMNPPRIEDHSTLDIPVIPDRPIVSGH